MCYMNDMRHFAQSAFLFGDTTGIKTPMAIRRASPSRAGYNMIMIAINMRHINGAPYSHHTVQMVVTKGRENDGDDADDYCGTSDSDSGGDNDNFMYYIQIILEIVICDTYAS